MIPPFEFENWAVIALGGIPNKTQVGDRGIDGRIFPVSSLPEKQTTKKGETPAFSSPLKKVWHCLPGSVFTGKVPVPHVQC